VIATNLSVSFRPTHFIASPLGENLLSFTAAVPPVNDQRYSVKPPFVRAAMALQSRALWTIALSLL